MASSQEKNDVRDMIQSLYKFANVSPAWDGEVNEQVAEVFGMMLAATNKCSDAFRWVATPPGGRASVTWLAKQLGTSLFNQNRDRLSFTCARAVIYKWHSTLEMASMGFAQMGGMKWA